MLVSALFRSASTHFCYDLSQKLGLIFLDEIFDPLNDDILKMKRINHEFRDYTGRLKNKKLGMQDKVNLWHQNEGYLINNHNYDIPWFEAANLFYCRKDLLGSLDSMFELIKSSKQPVENIWIYADWMRKFIEYVLICQRDRPLVIAEDIGYQFRKNAAQADEFVQEVFRKKINDDLYKDFLNYANTHSSPMEKVLKLKKELECFSKNPIMF